MTRYTVTTKKEISAYTNWLQFSDTFIFHMSFATLFIDVQSNEAFLTGLYVHPDERGKGIGSRLLYLCTNIVSLFRIQSIKLDDMSDFYGKEENIYIKSGFIYDDTTGPEMTGRVSVIKRKLCKYNQKIDCVSTPRTRH